MTPFGRKVGPPVPNTSTQTRTHSRAGFFIVFSFVGPVSRGSLGRVPTGPVARSGRGTPRIRCCIDAERPIRRSPFRPQRYDRLLPPRKSGNRYLGFARGTAGLPALARLRIQIGAAPTSVELHLKSLPMIMDELVVRARRDPKGKHIASFVETITLGQTRRTLPAQT